MSNTVHSFLFAIALAMLPAAAHPAPPDSGTWLSSSPTSLA